MTERLRTFQKDLPAGPGDLEDSMEASTQGLAGYADTWSEEKLKQFLDILLNWLMTLEDVCKLKVSFAQELRRICWLHLDPTPLVTSCF